MIGGRPRLGAVPGTLLILGATLVAYLPAWHAGFIWNDSDYVTAPGLQSWSGLVRIWTKLGAVQQYYPVLHSAFWTEHRLWGEAPFGYHLLNILLHATAACLFAQVLRRIFASDHTALLGGLLFALHPVCVESVAWITEQKNTLSTVFYLLSALAYLRYREARLADDASAVRRFYLPALALFTAAVLSKSVAATLPGALLVMVWWQNGRLSWRRDVLPLTPWFAVGAAAGIVTGWVERTYIGAQGEAFFLTPLDRILLAGRIPAFYLGKLLWPAHLVFIYPRWTVDAHSGWQWLFPIGWALALGILAWRVPSRAALAGALLFLGGLFPLLGFFNVYAFVFSYVADHWQYLAMLGLIAPAAGGWGWWREKAAGRGSVSRLLPVATAGAVLAALSALTWRECRAYRDSDIFYRTILARNPAAWMAHNNLGVLRYAAGDWANAKAEYDAALRLHPNYPEAAVNMGSLLRASGKPAEGIAFGLAAVRMQPLYAEAHNTLGDCLVDAGRPDEGMAQYREALRLKPDYPDAHSSLGIALADAGQSAAGIAHIQRALALKPDFPEGLNNLGIALVEAGRPSEAIQQYQAALRLRPNYADVHNNFGIALATAGRPQEAVAQYREALRLNPANAQAHNNLANTLAASHRIPEAIAELEAAVRIEPRLPEAHHNLSILFGMAGRLPEAMAEDEEALRLRADYPAARGHLEQIRSVLAGRH